MKLPKFVLLEDAPGSVWGVARLRNPVVLARFQRLNEGGLIAIFKPRLWPPDVLAQTTRNKLEQSLTRMVEFFEREADNGPNEWLMYDIEATLRLPRRLLVDNPASEFLGVLDTEYGVLFHVAEHDEQMRMILDWRMHPGMAPLDDAPALARAVREAHEWYNQMCE